MSLFPAFRAAPFTEKPVFVAEEQTDRVSDVQVLGTAVIPPERSLPSFSFDVSSAFKESSFVHPEVITLSSAEEGELADSDSERKRRKQRKKEKREKKERKRIKTESIRASLISSLETSSRSGAVISNSKKPVRPELRKSFLEKTGLPPDKAYCIDDKPEKLNFSFDDTYWKEVSKHKGPPRWSLGVRNTNTSRKQDFRYFTVGREYDAMRNSTGARVKKVEVEPFGRNYLPLPEDETDQPSESSSEVNSEPDEFRIRTARYNEKLRENPHDVGCWLEFLHFQDLLARNAFSSSSETKAEKRSGNRGGLLQRKVAIIDRAIEHNPGHIDLKIRRLNFCEEIWEKDELASEWRKFAFTHPNNPYVWTAYFGFLCSYFSLFQVSKTNAVYKKFFSVSRSIADGTFQSHAPVPHHKVHLVYFSSFLASFWLQSGHQEKAVAYLQALLEINLNFPENIQKIIPLKEALVYFESFWDSKVARFGDRGAQGWKNVMKSKDKHVAPTNDPEYEEKENNLIKSAKSTVELWLKLETFRQRSFLLPNPGTDEPTDPERVVLLDDISPYICRFPDDNTVADERVLFTMVVNVLGLLHCPMVRLYSTRSYAWKSGVPALLESPLSGLFATWNESHVISQATESYATALFQQIDPGWTNQSPLITGILEQASLSFVGLTQSFLSICLVQFHLWRWMEARSEEKTAAAREVRNCSKSLLKRAENRNNLLVWEWYAFAEGVLEGKAAALRILETVLGSMAPVAENPLQKLSRARLVRFYVVLMLDIYEGKRNSESFTSMKNCAVTALVQLAEESKFTFGDTSQVAPSRILRARNAFASWTESGSQNESLGCVFALGSSSCNITICAALLEYLTSGFVSARNILEHRIESAKAVAGSAVLPDFDPAREQAMMDWEILTETSVRLASHYQKYASMSSKQFRETVISCLRNFPDNADLLLIFISSELSVFISGNLRGYFDQATRGASTAVSWIFAIFSEYERKYRLWKNLNAACEHNLSDGTLLKTFRDTGVSHRLRSLFEQAVESDTGRHCPLVWRLYLRFEVEEENLGRAEGVYYRAMQSCPWAKSVYMDAARYFPQRIQEIVDVMTEKELRVFVPYDEAELLMDAGENIAGDP